MLLVFGVLEIFCLLACVTTLPSTRYLLFLGYNAAGVCWLVGTGKGGVFVRMVSGVSTD